MNRYSHTNLDPYGDTGRFFGSGRYERFDVLSFDRRVKIRSRPTSNSYSYCALRFRACWLEHRKCGGEKGSPLSKTWLSKTAKRFEK